jgi:hypothetical protein
VNRRILPILTPAMNSLRQSNRAGLLGLALLSLLATGAAVSGVGGAPLFAGQGASGEDNGECGGSGGTDRERQGPFGPDEEAVGTLPIKGRDAGRLVLPRHPGIYLRGDEQAVFGAVLAADGAGFVLIEEDPVSEAFQLTFHGDVELELDAGLLALAGVEVGLVATDPVHPTQAAALTEQALLMHVRLGVGDRLPLPLTEYEASGVLDGEGVNLFTASPLLGRNWMDARALGGVIRLGHTETPGL